MTREQRAREIKRYIEQNSELIINMVDEIVGEYVGELDDFIEKVKNILERVRQGQQDYTNDFLEMQMIKLPVIMYYSINGLEDLGAESDIAKAHKQQKYNEVYVRVTGTIPEREAESNMQVLNEAMMEAVYSRAYKKLKSKVDMADKLLSAIKKAMNKRIKEMDIELQREGLGRFDEEQ